MGARKAVQMCLDAVARAESYFVLSLVGFSLVFGVSSSLVRPGAFICIPGCPFAVVCVLYLPRKFGKFVRFPAQNHRINHEVPPYVVGTRYICSLVESK